MLDDSTAAAAQFKSSFQTAASVAASAGGMPTKQAGGELTKRAKGLLPGFLGDFVSDKASDMVQDGAKESALGRATAAAANAFALCRAATAGAAGTH